MIKWLDNVGDPRNKPVRSPETVCCFEVQINSLPPSPGLRLSPPAPGCARHSGKELGDGGAAPAPLDAPIPLTSLSLLPSPRAPGTLVGDLEKRGGAL